MSGKLRQAQRRAAALTREDVDLLLDGRNIPDLAIDRSPEEQICRWKALYVQAVLGQLDLMAQRVAPGRRELNEMREQLREALHSKASAWKDVDVWKAVAQRMGDEREASVRITRLEEEVEAWKTRFREALRRVGDLAEHVERCEFLEREIDNLERRNTTLRQRLAKEADA